MRRRSDRRKARSSAVSRRERENRKDYDFASAVLDHVRRGRESVSSLQDVERELRLED